MCPSIDRSTRTYAAHMCLHAECQGGTPEEPEFPSIRISRSKWSKLQKSERSAHDNRHI